MRAEDIKDAESLQAWLESLPQETDEERETARRWAVTIAHRAAMRVLPVYWSRSLDNESFAYKLSPITVLRGSMLASIAAMRTNFPSASINQIAFYSNKIAEDLVPEAAHSFAAFSCFSSLRVISDPDPAKALVETVKNSQDSAGDAGDDELEGYLYVSIALWDMVLSDLTLLKNLSRLDRKPLWQTDKPLSENWANARPKILAQGEGWRFWVEWYENALYGRPQDYDLLTKIALIDPADWDKGADHVNALIQRIVAEHLPKPKAKAPPAVVERVKASVPINAATLALQLHSLIETIAQEREHLRGLNAFSADEKQGLHDALDNLASTARHLLELLPEQTALSDQTAEDMASWSIVLKDQAQHWNTEAKKVVSGKPADDRVAFTGRLIFAAAVAAPLSLMGLGSFAAVAGGAILLKDKLDVQKVKDAIRSVTSSQ